MLFAASCLAACVTAPQSPSPPSVVSKPSLTAAPPKAPAAMPSQTQLSAVATSPAAASTAATPEDLKIDTPGASLLAGEPAREFERGAASWYGPRFQGRRTASGERFDTHAFTAAHRTLAFGTWVRVRNEAAGREVDVRINDRGPFIRSRVIDVSRAAAEALGLLSAGSREVLLLVPESTPAVVDPIPSLPAVKRRRHFGRAFKR